MNPAARLHQGKMMREGLRHLTDVQLRNLERQHMCCGLQVGDWPMCAGCRMASAAVLIRAERRFEREVERRKAARLRREEEREYDRRMEHEHHILGMSASEANRHPEYQ